jgi:hypothetical protein
MLNPSTNSGCEKMALASCEKRGVEAKRVNM